MSDNIVGFPERRHVIPVNDPDIPCERIVPCMACDGTSFKLLGVPEDGLTGVICNGCGHRMRLSAPCFLQPLETSA